MHHTTDFAFRKYRFLNGVHARLAARKRFSTKFVFMPDPPLTGSSMRGQELMQSPKTVSWPKSSELTEQDIKRQRFEGLDDLASMAEGAARQAGQEWIAGWIRRYGRGKGAGWAPDVTGCRIMAWMINARFLLEDMEHKQSTRFLQSLAQQVHYLSKRWNSAPSGLPRFEALCGLVCGVLLLEGFEDLRGPVLGELSNECAVGIDEGGGLPSRNPEELLSILLMLIRITRFEGASGLETALPLRDAICRITPVLRHLRHSDGGLARFHGGGRGQEGVLEFALAEAGVKTVLAEGMGMGYARLSAGRSSVIIDAAPPPGGAGAQGGHASTLAFELTSGRRPLVINCGSGKAYGAKWHRAGRATPSHSTLVLDTYSSARFGRLETGKDTEQLMDLPTDVPVELVRAPDILRFNGAHNGFESIHGLTHARKLELSFDGRRLTGEDTLLAVDPMNEHRFDQSISSMYLSGIPFEVRFHLHPDVGLHQDLGESSVFMELKSGEVWVLRHDGQCLLSLEPSVYFEMGGIRPRTTHQIVLTGRAVNYTTRIRWSLAKTLETADGIRDMHRQA